MRKKEDIKRTDEGFKLGRKMYEVRRHMVRWWAMA